MKSKGGRMVRASGADRQKGNRKAGWTGAVNCLTGTILSLLLVCFVITPVVARAAEWDPLIQRLVADGFEERTVRLLFERPEAAFDPAPMATKLRALVRTRDVKPAEDPTYRVKTVRRDYLQPAVVKRARLYSIENKKALSQVRQKYGVPEEIVVSILMVETRLGRFTGSWRAFNVLASMAVCEDLSRVRHHLASDLSESDVEAYALHRCQEKSDWAYRELKSLIRYAAQKEMDPLTIPGSIFGAIGLCQFMPSNVFRFGVDADGKGYVDLFTTRDALFSMGNYLKNHGWRRNMDRESRYRVLLTYNRSQVYANTVLALAERLQGRRPAMPEGRGG